MSVLDIIDEDLKSAMKAQDAERLSLLRMLKSALKNVEIANGKPLDDLAVLSVLEKQAKQRRDAATQYTDGGRPELAAKELSEADAIATYLPAKLDDADLEALVVSAINETGAKAISDMGTVIKAVMAKANGAADGRTVSEMVKKNLG